MFKLVKTPLRPRITRVAREKNVPGPPMDASPAHECLVCKSPVETEGEHRAASLKCGHVFGRSCLVDWLGENRGVTCPSCGASARRADIRVFYMDGPLTAPPSSTRQRLSETEARESIRRYRAIVEKSRTAVQTLIRTEKQLKIDALAVDENDALYEKEKASLLLAKKAFTDAYAALHETDHEEETSFLLSFANAQNNLIQAEQQKAAAKMRLHFANLAWNVSRTKVDTLEEMVGDYEWERADEEEILVRKLMD